VGAAALLTASAFACTQAAGLAATGPATISVTDTQLVDLHLGSGIGSREIVRTTVRQRVTGHRIGDSAEVCTYVTTRLRSCTATYRLPRGHLVVAGLLSSRLLYELAIVGGTGLYDNARGTLTSTAIKLRPRRDLLIFRLTG
jgi:hypothetical protein